MSTASVFSILYESSCGTITKIPTSCTPIFSDPVDTLKPWLAAMQPIPTASLRRMGLARSGLFRPVDPEPADHFLTSSRTGTPSVTHWSVPSLETGRGLIFLGLPDPARAAGRRLGAQPLKVHFVEEHCALAFFGAHHSLSHQSHQCVPAPPILVHRRPERDQGPRLPRFCGSHGSPPPVSVRLPCLRQPLQVHAALRV